MILGSTPTTALDTISASGSNLCSLRPASFANNNAAEPSLSPLEFPAVTDPPSFLKAGLRFARISGVVLV